MFTIPPVVHRLSSLSVVSLGVLFSATQTLFSGSNGSPHQVFTPELSAYIQGALLAGEVQGLTATALFANHTASPEFATFGNRSEDGVPVEPETLFYIGSCSKAFLGASLGILMEDFMLGNNQTALPAGIKSFTWETKIHDLITGSAEWKLSDQFSTERANLRDLLAHVTGLSGHDLYYRKEDDPEDLLNRMQYLKQNRELRQQWQYNNIMYIIGAHIVSTYAGKPFTEFVRERIFTPLNMTSSYYYASKVPSELSISQSFSGPRRTPLWTADDRLAKLIAGAGGILTNTVDITKWLATLLNSGVNPVNNQTIVPKDAFDITTSAYVIEPALLPEASGLVSGYGGGWERFSYRGHEVILHTGGVIGFLSVLAFFPNDGVATFVSLNNGWAAATLGDVATKIFDSLLGLPSDLSSPSASAVTPDATSDAADANTDTTVDLSAYAGTYTDPGYGNITFCAPTSTSGSCLDILADFSSIIPDVTASSGLYANWDRFWTKSAMLVPVSGNSWKFSTFNIYAHGFGRNTTPFTDSYLPEPFPVVFDVEGGEVKGFGLFGGFIGAIVDGEAEESIPVKDRAEAYFSKV